ncbi:MAG: UbiD family decarboxylase [Candidatus Dasytiphilus stammeri]
MRNLLSYISVQKVEQLLSPNLEVSKYLHDKYHNLVNYPITIFNKIMCKSNIPYVDNLLKRKIIFKGLEMTEKNYLKKFYNRINRLPPGYHNCAYQNNTNNLILSSYSLLDLPFLKYQPQDAGRYLTSFILCIEDINGISNLGFYRGEIKNHNTIAIFIDRRTDAFRILTECLQRRKKSYISLFNGGPIATYISAASKISATIDSYLFANALSPSAITLLKNNPYPAVPSTSEIVLYGYTEGKKIQEGPFCEFKGYYSDKTYSYEVKINQIYTRQDPYFFGIFCGKESGLNLMQFQNETFMFHQLLKHHVAVKRVIYPLNYFAEFCTIIETEIPTIEILKLAMNYDYRSKLFFIVRNADTIFSDLAIFNFSLLKDSYIKHGVKIGNRIGIMLDNRNNYEWSEY